THSYTLSLHDALPICNLAGKTHQFLINIFFQIEELVHLLLWNTQGMPLGIWADIQKRQKLIGFGYFIGRKFSVDDLCKKAWHVRSEEHTSELQSRENL